MSVLGLNKRILAVAGIWPAEEGDRYRITTICYSCVAILLQASLLVNQALAVGVSGGNLASESLNVCVMTTIAAGLLKGAAIIMKKKQIKVLVRSLQKAELAHADSVAKMVTIYYIGVGGAAVIVWNLMPLLLEGSRSLPTIAWYPYEVMKSPHFELTYFLQGISTFYCCITNVGVNIFIVSLILYICAMLKNLQEALSSIGRKRRKISNEITSIQPGTNCDKLILKEEFSTKEDEQVVNEKFHNLKNSGILNEDESVMYSSLIDCVKEHQKIISLVTELGNCVSAVIFVEFVAGIVVTCLTLFHAAVNMENKALFLKFVMYLLYMTVGMFIYCWYGQDLIQQLAEYPAMSLYVCSLSIQIYMNGAISTKCGKSFPWQLEISTVGNEALQFAAYNCSWPGASRKVCNILRIIMMRTQRPMMLTALKFYTVSLQTFVKVLNAGFSYYAVLRQMNDKGKLH